MNTELRVVRHGDTVGLILGYTVNGEPMTEGSVDEIEFCFGGFRFTLTGGDIIWNAEEDGYMVKLTQEQTFALPKTCMYQVRVKVGDEVGSIERKYMGIGDTISKEVL